MSTVQLHYTQFFLDSYLFLVKLRDAGTPIEEGTWGTPESDVAVWAEAFLVVLSQCTRLCQTLSPNWGDSRLLRVDD